MCTLWWCHRVMYTFMFITSLHKMTSSVKKQTSCTSVDTVNKRVQALALLDAGLGVKDRLNNCGKVGNKVETQARAKYM